MPFTVLNSTVNSALVPQVTTCAPSGLRSTRYSWLVARHRAAHREERSTGFVERDDVDAVDGGAAVDADELREVGVRAAVDADGSVIDDHLTAPAVTEAIEHFLQSVVHHRAEVQPPRVSDRAGHGALDAGQRVEQLAVTAQTGHRPSVGAAAIAGRYSSLARISLCQRSMTGCRKIRFFDGGRAGGLRRRREAGVVLVGRHVGCPSAARQHGCVIDGWSTRVGSHGVGEVAARIEVEGIEESIVKAIVAERATFHACTARQLSRRIGYHHSYISEILQKMKQAGIVDFAVEVPGSIHLVGTVEAQWAETQVVDGDGAPMFDPNDAPIMAPADRTGERCSGASAEVAQRREARCRRSPHGGTARGQASGVS